MQQTVVPTGLDILSKTKMDTSSWMQLEKSLANGLALLPYNLIFWNVSWDGYWLIRQAGSKVL